MPHLCLRLGPETATELASDFGRISDTTSPVSGRKVALANDVDGYIATATWTCCHRTPWTGIFHREQLPGPSFLQYCAFHKPFVASCKTSGTRFLSFATRSSP